MERQVIGLRAYGMLLSALGVMVLAAVMALVGFGCMAPSVVGVGSGVAASSGSGGGGGVGRFSRVGGAEGAKVVLPPGVALGRDEELWVIEKRAGGPAGGSEEVPGTGAMVTTREGRVVAMPLEHTDVRARVSGYVASVDVTQRFGNPFDTKIEAVYVFPLPANAAVTDFVMRIGDRQIRGVIREREEAKRIYEAARNQGYVAALLTQERPNVFTQSVANIEPGKKIEVRIRYFNALSYGDGWYELAFPTVVGPRFNPPGATGGIGAVANGERAGASGQPTQVPYLKAGERTGHDLSLAVDLEAGVGIEALECRTHEVKVVREGGASRAVVTLAGAGVIPNRDFVLRWKVAGAGVKTGVIATRDAKGEGYFSLMIVPPAELTGLERRPVEMVFTLDVSGSMTGRPIEQARAAVRHALANLDGRDSFNVVRFASTAEAMSERAVRVTPENVRRGLAFLEGSDAGGGTMMMEGIRKSLLAPREEGRQRFVAFLTDGYIGNEAEILGEIHRSVGDGRLFGFGVGTSVNRYLIDHMAKAGRGAAAYVDLVDDPKAVMGAYLARVSRPAMTDLVLGFEGVEAAEVYPAKLPDVLVGRPVVVSGRFKGERGRVTVRGVAGTGVVALTVPIEPVGEGTGEAVMGESSGEIAAGGGSAVATLWARAKIADLCDRGTWDAGVDVSGGVKRVALEYGLLSPFTAFVAVDGTRKTEGAFGVTVPVAVPVPEGVRYETTVPGGER